MARANLGKIVGNGISKIEKTKTEGLVDTYTISYTNGESTEFTVVNGEDWNIERIEKTISDNIVTIEPNKFYIFPEMESLSISLAEPTNSDIVNEYRFRFTSGSVPTTLVLSDTIKGSISVNMNCVYEVSIVDNYLVSYSWEK